MLSHGTYIGPIESLKGKTALLIENIVNPGVSAQFDDVSPGYDYGWTNFASEDFDLDDPELN